MAIGPNTILLPFNLNDEPFDDEGNDQLPAIPNPNENEGFDWAEEIDPSTGWPVDIVGPISKYYMIDGDQWGYTDEGKVVNPGGGVQGENRGYEPIFDGVIDDTPITPFEGVTDWSPQNIVNLTSGTLVAGTPTVDTVNQVPGTPLDERLNMGQIEEESDGSPGLVTADMLWNFIKAFLPDPNSETFPQEMSEFFLDMTMDARAFSKGAAAGAIINVDGPLPFSEIIGGLSFVTARRILTPKAKEFMRGLVDNLTGPFRTFEDLTTGGMLNTGTGINYSQRNLFDVTEYLGPLRPESKEAARVFNDYLATKSGYASMAEFKRTVLNRWPRKYQEQLFRELWQNQNYEGYIEHLIQKAPHMDWYWNMKGLDRNAVENVRILFNDSMKGFKDTVEKIVHGYRRRDGTFVLGKGWQSPNLENRLIVSFEDPMKRTKTFLRQNPGDIIIMRAGSNKIIGNLGQYFDILYPQDALGKRLLREGSRKAGFKNVTEFRRTILEQRIDTIIADSHTIPANRTAAKRWIKQNIDEDMINLIQQYPFLQPNPAIKKQMIKDGLLPGSYISPIK